MMPIQCGTQIYPIMTSMIGTSLSRVILGCLLWSNSVKAIVIHQYKQLVITYELSIVCEVFILWTILILATKFALIQLTWNHTVSEWMNNAFIFKMLYVRTGQKTWSQSVYVVNMFQWCRRQDALRAKKRDYKKNLYFMEKLWEVQQLIFEWENNDNFNKKY